MLPEPDKNRIDRVIEFALAAAAREDESRDRELGPIHLVKLVYLADLAHAATHGGETFTHVPWLFHHYGPWAVEVFHRIEPATQAIGASRRTFQGRHDADVVRYCLNDDALFDRLERVLPWEVVSAVRRAVHEHGTDTESLLHHVYGTVPMLRAAPGETLDFTAALRREPLGSFEDLPANKEAVQPPGNRRAERDRRRTLAQLREQVQKRLAERLSRPRAPVSPPPRYDEVFFEGTKQLDELAGPRPAEGEAEAAFSNDVWKSSTRGGRDLP